MVLTMCSVTTRGNSTGGGSGGSRATWGASQPYHSGMWTYLQWFTALEVRAPRFHPLTLTLHPKYSIETQQKLTTYTHFSANIFLMLVLHKRSDGSNRRAIRLLTKKKRKKRGSKESYPRFKGTFSQCDWADNCPISVLRFVSTDISLNWHVCYSYTSEMNVALANMLLLPPRVKFCVLPLPRNDRSEISTPSGANGSTSSCIHLARHLV